MLVPTSSRRSFQFMQATWQALQPMHLLSSISFATCGALVRTCGVAVVVAERATTSWLCRLAMVFSLRESASRRLGPRQGAANEMSVGFSCHAFSMFTRNALNSGVCEFASPTYGVSELA